jgi:hypothetical protein
MVRLVCSLLSILADDSSFLGGTDADRKLTKERVQVKHEAEECASVSSTNTFYSPALS